MSISNPHSKAAFTPPALSNLLFNLWNVGYGASWGSACIPCEPRSQVVWRILWAIARCHRLTLSRFSHFHHRWFGRHSHYFVWTRELLVHFGTGNDLRACFVWHLRPAEWHSTVGELPIASQGSDTMRRVEPVDQRPRHWHYVCGFHRWCCLGAACAPACVTAFLFDVDVF